MPAAAGGGAATAPAWGLTTVPGWTAPLAPADTTAFGLGTLAPGLALAELPDALTPTWGVGAIAVAAVLLPQALASAHTSKSLFGDARKLRSVVFGISSVPDGRRAHDTVAWCAGRKAAPFTFTELR
jgi:hypothetical protein